jgi:O-antigen/teichoic acid export membrane protein
MARMQHQAALWGDLIFYCGYAALALILKVLHSMTVESALLCLAAMALTSFVLYVRQGYIAMVGFGSGWQLLRMFWPQGRWIAVANASAALTSQGFAWALALFGGPSAVAAFQAILNLSNAGNPIILGVGNLLVPATALAGTQSGPRAATRTALRLGARGGVLVGIYFALLLLLPSTFLSLAYGHQSSYFGLTNSLRLLAIAQLIQYPGQMITALLNGIGENRGAFNAQLAATLTTCAVGLPLTLLRGVNGAALGLACSNCARCLMALRVLRHKTAKPSLELAGESI